MSSRTIAYTATQSLQLDRVASCGATTLMRMLCLVTITLALLIEKSYPLLHAGLGSHDEVQLIEYLFDRQGYNPLVRPVYNLSETVRVQFGMALIQLIDVDEKNQIMKTNVWLRMLWSDYQLKWDPSDYGSITAIRVAANKVWKPDIVLFNNADGKYEVSYKPKVVIFYTGDVTSDVIFYTGDVLWIPPAIFKSSCTIDVEYFPFDEQRCEMKFGSWTYTSNQVTLDWYESHQQVDLSDYVYSGSWDIIGCPAQLATRSWSAVTGHLRASMTFVLHIRRKTLFYTVNLIVPCVLIAMLSIAVFYLPASAGEKMTMSISIQLALIVFLLLVSKILPPSSLTVPLVARYILFTFLMNVLTIVGTVVVIHWNFRTPSTHRMSGCVRRVFVEWLPKLLFVRRPRRVAYWASTFSATRWRRRLDSSLTAAFASARLRAPATDRPMETMIATPRRSQAVMCPTTRTADEVEVGEALAAVAFVASHLDDDDEYAEAVADWQYVALVIDRIQMLIFAVATAAGCIGLITNAPHVFVYINQDDIKNKLMNRT